MSGEAAVEDEAAVALESEVDDTLKGGDDADGTVDIVLEGEESQEAVKSPKNPVRDMRKRIKEQNRENSALREEVNVLKQAMQSGGTPRVEEPKVVVPTERPTLASTNYDTGEYELQMEAYMAGGVERAIDKRLINAKQQDNNKADESSIAEHYKRATDLNVGDYEEMEDKAIEALGVDIVQSLQTTVDQSEMLIYYLGKNPKKAAEIRSTFDRNPAKATFELGTLAAKLTLKPRGDKIPAPDDPLGGGGGGVNPHYNKYFKMLQKAYDDGDLDTARKVRTEAKDKGVELPYNSV